MKFDRADLNLAAQNQFQFLNNTAQPNLTNLYLSSYIDATVTRYLPTYVNKIVADVSKPCVGRIRVTCAAINVSNVKTTN